MPGSSWLRPRCMKGASALPAGPGAARFETVPRPQTSGAATMISARSLLLAFPLLLGAGALRAQSAAGTVVIVTGEQATLPIPTLMEGRAARTANFDVADQLFLRLAINQPG